MGYYIYTHTNTSISTVDEALFNSTSILVGYATALKEYKNSKDIAVNATFGITDITNTPTIPLRITTTTLLKTKEDVITEFLDYKPFSITGKSLSNRDILKKEVEKRKLTDKYNLDTLPESDWPIFPGTQLYCEDRRTDISILSVEGSNNEIKERDFKAFISKELVKLISDPKYTPSTKYKNLKGSAIVEQYPEIEILIWIRSIDKLVNVTKFVDMVNTNVTGKGGAFNLSLAPVVLRNIDKTNFNSSVLKSLNVIGSDSFISNSTLYDSDGKRNRFVFHELIGVNDLVLIKFEELSLKNENRDISQLEVPLSNIPNQIYDMIGLVDSSTIVTNPSGGDVSISISGRDCMKLLQEDGSQFIPISLIDGSDAIFNQTQDENKVIKRFFLPNEFSTQLFTQVFRPIDFTLKFLINQCSNIGIIPNRVFSEYPEDKIAKVYRISKEDQKTPKLERQRGLWQIIKLNLDAQLDDRRLADASLSQPDGSIMEQFSKTCQEPLVEFFGDTYGDQYVINVRKPPFTGKTIINWIDNDSISKSNVAYEDSKSEETKRGEREFIQTIYDEDIISENLMFNEDDIFTFFQIDSCFVSPSGSPDNILPWIPVCYFKQYVEIWGMKKFFLSDIYLGYGIFKDKSKVLDGKNWNYTTIISSVVEDLAFCIDSYAYMPFVRKGSVTINGDRRIKRGTWIRLDGTKEIYYVDSVSNSASTSGSSIDRTTTLSLTRGMVEKYCKGIIADDKKSSNDTSFSELNFRSATNRTVERDRGAVIPETPIKKLYNDISYFNIINTEAIKEKIFEVAKMKKQNNIKSIIQLNDDVFEFFLNRKQFR